MRAREAHQYAKEPALIALMETLSSPVKLMNCFLMTRPRLLFPSPVPMSWSDVGRTGQKANMSASVHSRFR